MIKSGGRRQGKRTLDTSATRDTKPVEGKRPRKEILGGERFKRRNEEVGKTKMRPEISCHTGTYVSVIRKHEIILEIRKSIICVSFKM